MFFRCPSQTTIYTERSSQVISLYTLFSEKKCVKAYLCTLFLQGKSLGTSFSYTNFPVKIALMFSPHNVYTKRGFHASSSHTMPLEKMSVAVLHTTSAQGEGPKSSYRQPFSQIECLMALLHTLVFLENERVFPPHTIVPQVYFLHILSQRKSGSHFFF